MLSRILSKKDKIVEEFHLSTSSPQRIWTFGDTRWRVVSMVPRSQTKQRPYKLHHPSEEVGRPSIPIFFFTEKLKFLIQFSSLYNLRLQGIGSLNVYKELRL